MHKRTALLCLLFASAVQAQPPQVDTAAIRSAMAPLVRMAGCWTGDGAMRTGPGPARPARGVEWIEPRLDGTLVTVQGRFRALGPDQALGPVIHSAFATIVTDGAGGFRFTAFLSNGLNADMRGRLEGSRFSWSPPAVAGRQTRYIADWSVENRWHEVGEFSMDGTNWVRFMEMTLHRQPDASTCQAAFAG